MKGYKNNLIKVEIMFNLLTEKMKYDSLIICKVDKGQTTFRMDADDYVWSTWGWTAADTQSSIKCNLLLKTDTFLI